MKCWFYSFFLNYLPTHFTSLPLIPPGAVIGLELSGEYIIQKCQDLVNEVTQGKTDVVYVSNGQDGLSPEEQIEAFYNYADMQMGI